MRRVALALVHYPVLDKERELVTTAITGLDLHDLARTAHSYDLFGVYIVHPIEAQRALALRVRGHWTLGSGARRIPDRKPALERLRIVPNVEDALADLGPSAEIWVTSAGADADRVLFGGARAVLAEEGPPVLLCFGTGWGLAPTLFERATVKLEPVRSRRADGYNHLSVRAAAAIIVDRLFGG